MEAIFENRGRQSITYIEFCRVYRELVLQPDLDMACGLVLRTDSRGAPNKKSGGETQSPMRPETDEKMKPSPLPTIRSQALLPPFLPKS